MGKFTSEEIQIAKDSIETERKILPGCGNGFGYDLQPVLLVPV